MTEIIHGKIVGPYSRVVQMLNKATRNGKGNQDNAYFHFSKNALRVIYALPGNTATSYSTFHAPDYLTEVSTERDEEYGEAIIDIDAFFDYLDLIQGTDNVELIFKGDVNSEVATVCEMRGALTARIHLPAADSILDMVPRWISQNFNSDNKYFSQTEDGGKKYLPTTVHTQAEELQRIVKVVESDNVSGIVNFPFVVRDGNLTMEAGDEQTRNSVFGSLNGKVEGEDVANAYQPGFVKAVESLSGSVEIQTAHGGPLVIVYDEIQGATIRHILALTTTLD